MFLHRALLASFAVGLVPGCASLPSYRDDAVSTAEIIRHIKCELRDAVWTHPENGWARHWKAGLDFTFEVYHKGGLDSDNSWTFPLNHGATFVVALKGGFSGEATRTERIKFDEALDELQADPLLWCDDEGPDRYARLSGQLGLADLLERVGHSIADAHLRNLTALNYNLDYVIKKSAGLTPKFNLVPIGKEKLFSGSLAWAGSQSDSQNLKLVLTPPAAKVVCPVDRVEGACPALVYVVNTAPAYGILNNGSGGERSQQFHSEGSLSRADRARLNQERGQNVIQDVESQLRRLDVDN